VSEDADIIDDPDAEVEATTKTSSSAGWLARIEDAEKTFREWQQKSDNIDKLYGSLERLSKDTRDREFQLFWANIQVLGPSIYSRPPVPVVVPRFKDRRPVPRVASELLERTAVVGFELEDIDSVMRLVRDDLCIVARGSIWLRYEAKNKSENNLTQKVCVEHADRKDFLHDPARNWKEVDWVAKRSWMTKGEMRKRFFKSSGKAYQEAGFDIQKDDRENGAAGKRTKAGVWELWCKSKNKVVWVTEGVDVVLEEDEPHLSLEGFFPCPRPAYGTTQRRSLVPLPDMIFYKDQLEEINELTARIAALTDSVKVRGFYPAGAGEIGDAVQAALKSVSNNQVLVPISNWAAFGGGQGGDPIVWLPLDMITTTIVQLVSLRRQLIDDVYQITGLSDIMRGASDPNETLGAQELKSQYGSVRVRDRQQELVRIARDSTRIMAEIMAENFQSQTLLDMSQMEIATDADIKKKKKPIEDQIKQIEQDIEDARTNPETVALAQQQPQKAQELLQQAQQQIEQANGQIKQLDETVTIEKVMKFLRDQRIRPFVLDIETDSTIQPNEDAEKRRRTEFSQALAGVIAQVAPLVSAQPATAPFAGQLIKFTLAPFRAGREMESAVDEFVEQMQQVSGQKPEEKPDPNIARIQGEMQIKQAESQGRQQEIQAKSQAAVAELKAKLELMGSEMQGKQVEQGLRLQEIQAKMQADAQKHQQEMQKGALELEKLRLEIAKLGDQMQAQSQKSQIEIAKALQPEVIGVVNA
jgi:hypothetical protein